MQDRENAAILLDYCDRRLDTDLMRRISSHVEVCVECQNVLAAQRQVWSALDAWEPAPVSTDFNRRLYARIEREEAAGFWKRLFAPVTPVLLRPALPVAAACLLVVGTLLFQTPQEPSLGKQAGAELVDLDQVEKALDDMEMLRQMGVFAGSEGGV
ncbi:MAG: hypothetical protein FJW20_01895 [Acidimicrobiia bacterium]|nr:hypothetical protein [Acidimicrobiia bacterium]